MPNNQTNDEMISTALGKLMAQQKVSKQRKSTLTWIQIVQQCLPEIVSITTDACELGSVKKKATPYINITSSVASIILNTIESRYQHFVDLAVPNPVAVEFLSELARKEAVSIDYQKIINAQSEELESLSSVGFFWKKTDKIEEKQEDINEKIKSWISENKTLIQEVKMENLKISEGEIKTSIPIDILPDITGSGKYKEYIKEVEEIEKTTSLSNKKNLSALIKLIKEKIQTLNQNQNQGGNNQGGNNPIPNGGSSGIGPQAQ